MSSNRLVRVAAVDLGATSGRVVSAVVGTDQLHTTEVHRFSNNAIPVRKALYWNILGIYGEVVDGLMTTIQRGPVDGIGVDSWAVDFGLLDHAGDLTALPRSHRDPYTFIGAKLLERAVEADELYTVTGLQQLPFNTACQLLALAASQTFDRVETLLLLPDLLCYWLTGRTGAERTNASTTQLYDVRTRDWASDLANKLGLPDRVLPPIREPGTIIGPLTADVQANITAPRAIPVIAVCSHDTASAVVATPAANHRFAYISSGTWSLVGLELSTPILSKAARTAGYSNETGADGTVRFLTNVMGLWLLEESVRAWKRQGYDIADTSSLVAAAAHLTPLRTVIDVNDELLLPPSAGTDTMPARVAALAAQCGEPVPTEPPEFVRCVLDSLAVAYRRQIRTASQLAQQPVDTIHVVGGGSRNRLLCQLTSDACEVPVVAGPAEAAAIGNALLQARALGIDIPELEAMRALVRSSVRLVHYQPRADVRWETAERRVFGD